MKGKYLIALVFLISIAGASALEAYNINMTYIDGEFYLNSISIIQTNQIADGGGNYYFDIISLKNQTLSRSYFSIPKVIYDMFDPQTGGASDGWMINNNTNFILQAGYHDDAREIKIYDVYDFEMLSIDVSQFAKIKPGLPAAQPRQSVAERPVDLAAYKKPIYENVVFWIVIAAAMLAVMVIAFIMLPKRHEQPQEIKPVYPEYSEQ